jgi:hypothetical protein
MVISRQELTAKSRERPAKEPLETKRAVLADTQSDSGAVTARKNPPQLRAISSSIQM